MILLPRLKNGNKVFFLPEKTLFPKKTLIEIKKEDISGITLLPSIEKNLYLYLTNLKHAIMLVKTFGSAVFGINAATITIEADVTKGIKFLLVGLPDNAIIKISKEGRYP